MDSIKQRFKDCAESFYEDGVTFRGEYSGRYYHRGYAIVCDSEYDYAQFCIALATEFDLLELAQERPHIDNMGHSMIYSWNMDLFGEEE